MTVKRRTTGYQFFSWFVSLLLFISLRPKPQQLYAHADSHNNHNALRRNGPYHPQAVKEWIQAKCGGGNTVVWAFEGALYDPMTGNRICSVEGMEMIMPLASCFRSNPNQCLAYRYKCGNLAIRQLLFPNKKSTKNRDWDYATTVLSRKIFCYKQDSNNLLESIKAHPSSPTRSIPRRQSLQVWDAATTYVCRGGKSQEMYIHSEQPNAVSLSSSSVATSWSDDEPNNNSFDFTIYTKRKKKPLLRLPRLLTNSDGNTTTTTTASPPRSKLVQIGSDKKQLLDKFGARETYSYSIPQSQQAKPRSMGWLGRGSDKEVMDTSSLKPSVLYTRYGEGPPWLGPGRMCTLELRGKRVDSIQQAPPVIYKHCFSNPQNKFVPKFLLQGKTKGTKDNMTNRLLAQPDDAVNLFREEGTTLLLENKTSSRFFFWKRLRAATSLSDAEADEP